MKHGKQNKHKREAKHNTCDTHSISGGRPDGWPRQGCGSENLDMDDVDSGDLEDLDSGDDMDSVGDRDLSSWNSETDLQAGTDPSGAETGTGDSAAETGTWTGPDGEYGEPDLDELGSGAGNIDSEAGTHEVGFTEAAAGVVGLAAAGIVESVVTADMEGSRGKEYPEYSGQKDRSQDESQDPTPGNQSCTQDSLGCQTLVCLDTGTLDTKILDTQETRGT